MYILYIVEPATARRLVSSSLLLKTGRFPKKPFVYTFAQQRLGISSAFALFVWHKMILVLILHVVYCTHLSTRVFSVPLLAAFRWFASTSHVVQSNEFVTTIKAQTLRCQPHFDAIVAVCHRQRYQSVRWNYVQPMRAYIYIYKCSPLSGWRCDRPKYTLTTNMFRMHVPFDSNLFKWKTNNIHCTTAANVCVEWMRYTLNPWVIEIIK